MNPLQNSIHTLKFLGRIQNETLLIKLGGTALQDQELVKSICEDLALIHSVGINFILVHGGGPIINKELSSRGMSWSFINGIRITPPEMMDVIEMVLCGHVNQRIVRILNQTGINAIGLSGADATLLKCRQADPLLQQVGVIEEVNVSIIKSLLQHQHLSTSNSRETPPKPLIPVIAPIGVGSNGEIYNINADWAASRIAESMNIRRMIFLTDQDGILDSQLNLISEVDVNQLVSLIEQEIIHGGMLAKAQTIIYALRNGVNDIHILNAQKPHSLIEGLFTDNILGTLCRLNNSKSNQKEFEKSTKKNMKTLNFSSDPLKEIL